MRHQRKTHVQEPTPLVPPIPRLASRLCKAFGNSLAFRETAVHHVLYLLVVLWVLLLPLVPALSECDNALPKKCSNNPYRASVHMRYTTHKATHVPPTTQLHVVDLFEAAYARGFALLASLRLVEVFFPRAKPLPLYSKANSSATSCGVSQQMRPRQATG